ncbi:MAG TPA: hypothetical protein VK935_19260 [Actinomycetospora sp.]|nr:hypothetical protein [Actinomycetospora sp.]
MVVVVWVTVERGGAGPTVLGESNRGDHRDVAPALTTIFSG